MTCINIFDRVEILQMQNKLLIGLGVIVVVRILLYVLGIF